MKHRNLGAIILMLVGSLVVAASASAAPTVDSSVSIVGQGPLFAIQPQPVNLILAGDITPGVGDTTLSPLMEAEFTLPADLAIVTNPTMPVCTAVNQANSNFSSATARQMCPTSIIGDGTARFNLAQQVSAPINDPELTVFNGGKANDGSDLLSIHAYSALTNQGIFMTGAFKNGKLNIKVPRLTADSSVSSFRLNFPGFVGQNPSYAQAACPAGTYTSSAAFNFGNRDDAGNISNTSTLSTAPENQSCTAAPDTIAPNTVIDSGPVGFIHSNQATFNFSGAPAIDTAKIQCKLDLGPFTDCISPKTFSALSDGAHTATFRAEDAVGNQDAAPAARTFTVDTTPPSVAATSLSYPSQGVGTLSAPLTVTLTNASGDVLNQTGDDLTIDGVSVSGQGRTDFFIAGEDCTEGPIPVLGTCVVPIRFSPSAIGSRTATLHIRYAEGSDGLPAALTVPLSGNGSEVAAGPTGATGAIGPVGPTGLQGAAGEGTQGPTGKTGAQGRPGKDAKVTCTVKKKTKTKVDVTCKVKYQSPSSYRVKWSLARNGKVVSRGKTRSRNGYLPLPRASKLRSGHYVVSLGGRAVASFRVR